MALQIALTDITATENAVHALLLRKDAHALRHVQDLYGDILYRHLYNILHEEIKTSVALCETFKKIWLLLGICDPPRPGLLNWMLRIAEDCAAHWKQEAQQYSLPRALAPTGS
jgi:hypothetical protein